CLAAFENFLRKGEKSCPLCRKSDYQKRSTFKGAIAWRNECARRIQSLIRGVAARSTFRNLLRQHYTAVAADPSTGTNKGPGGGAGARTGAVVDLSRRARFLAGEAADSAGRLAEAVERQGESVDRFLNELDWGLAFSRAVFGGGGGG
ncbi:unnamed protein product, partial [Discosporangium mesarthrocarpum]